MTTQATSTISPRETSLLHLNQLVDELEFLTGTFTEDATPTVLALIKQIRRAGREHYDFFQKGESESDIRAFEAMFDRFQAAEAAGKAVIAGKETGAQAGQATARAGSAPSSSSTSAEAPAIVSKETRRVTAEVDEAGQVTAGAKAGQITAGAAAAPASLPVVTARAIAELQSNQAAIVASLADLQKKQAEVARKQEALTSSLADLQRNQEALTSSVLPFVRQHLQC